MPIEKQKDGKVVCIFGTGDILIAPGIDEGSKSPYAMQITLSQQDNHPVDISMPELKGKILEAWAVKMYFDDSRSIDSFIHVLEDFKKDRFPWSTAAKDSQPLPGNPQGGE
jgi:hypothetical protein